MFYWNGIRNITQSSLLKSSTFAGHLKSVGIFLESGLVLAGMQASKSTLAPNNMYSDTRPIGSRMTSQLRLTFGHSRPGFFRFPQEVKAIAMPGGDAISLVARDSEKLIDATR